MKIQNELIHNKFLRRINRSLWAFKGLGGTGLSALRGCPRVQSGDQNEHHYRVPDQHQGHRDDHGVGPDRADRSQHSKIRWRRRWRWRRGGGEDALRDGCHGGRPRPGHCGRRRGHAGGGAGRRGRLLHLEVVVVMVVGRRGGRGAGGGGGSGGAGRRGVAAHQVAEAAH